MSINIGLNKNLFLAYTGLTAAGYDLINKGDKELDDLISKIKGLKLPQETKIFFESAAFGNIQVNPYWPRGSMLSAGA